MLPNIGNLIKITITIIPYKVQMCMEAEAADNVMQIIKYSDVVKAGGRS